MRTTWWREIDSNQGYLSPYCLPRSQNSRTTKIGHSDFGPGDGSASPCAAPDAEAFPHCRTPRSFAASRNQEVQFGVSEQIGLATQLRGRANGPSDRLAQEPASRPQGFPARSSSRPGGPTMKRRSCWTMSARKINVIVVYKVDRLTGSLPTSPSWSSYSTRTASASSVTPAFNTTTASDGRPAKG